MTKDGNKNMVNAFAATEWADGSDSAVLSRSFTSCAGITAYQWRSRKKFPSAHPTGAECPKGGSHSGAADLHHYGTLGYAWLSRGSYHHGLPEIWDLL